MFERQKKLLRARASLIEVARQNGETLEQVRAEIYEAMQEAMKSDDLLVQYRWKKIAKGGRVPTPEEFIVAIWDMMDEEKKPALQ